MEQKTEEAGRKKMSLQETEKQLKQLKDSLIKKQKELIEYITESELKISQIQRETALQQKNMQRAAGNLSKVLGGVDARAFRKFLERPYKIKQFYDSKKRQTYYEVYVPKWVPNFSIGWRKQESEDDTFWTYVVNQYSAWLGEVPSHLAETMNLGNTAIEATVRDGTVKFPESQKAKAEEMFKGSILKWDLDHAKIKQGHEFDVILKIIRSGHMPYEKIPVDREDMRTPEITFEPFSYQKPPIKKFFETGAVGVFHPTGAGKSFVAIYCADSLKGRKIIVTRKTMIDQWEYYFEKYAPRLKEETDIVNYELLRARPEYFQNNYVLGIFDECHVLPASTFIKSSTLKIKYRMGLSASPHREDGNEDLIYALTGFAEGINWSEYYKIRGMKQHPVHVHLVRNPSQKISKVRQLLNMNKKTVIFVQKLEIGRHIANEFGLPFISGETENRLEIAKNCKVFVASDVMSLGVSLDDLQRIIEVDFLFGSRMQELQRSGRLGHSSEKDKRHDIIMTDQEYADYGKRIWVLEDYGFHVRVENGD
jgi:DNA excision repair protein ERCC-3